MELKNLKSHKITTVSEHNRQQKSNLNVFYNKNYEPREKGYVLHVDYLEGGYANIFKKTKSELLEILKTKKLSINY